MSYFERLKGSIRRNFEQVELFGLPVLLRHFKSKQPTYQFNYRGFGPVNVRVDESDIYTFVQVVKRSEYDVGIPSVEEHIRKQYDDIVATGRVPVIVDAGANVGAAALWFARRYPKAHIVAVEPESGNAAVLHRNAELEKNITVLEAAIGCSSGKVSLQGSTGSGWDVSTERSSEGEINLVTMAEAIDTVENGTPFIAKIDIEGFESDLFSQATDWVGAMKVIMIEPHDWIAPGNGSSLTFQRVLGQNEFELFIRGENLIYVRY